MLFNSWTDSPLQIMNYTESGLSCPSEEENMDWSADSNEIHNLAAAKSQANEQLRAVKEYSNEIQRLDTRITSQTKNVTKSTRSPKRIDGDGKEVGHRWSIGTNLDYIWDGSEWLYKRTPTYTTYEDKKQHDQYYTRSFEKFMGIDGGRDHYSVDPDDSLLHVQPKPKKSTVLTKGVITADYTPFKEADTAAHLFPRGSRWEQRVNDKLIASWYSDGDVWVQDYKLYVEPPIQKHAQSNVGTTTLEEILKTSELDLKDYNPRETYLNLLNRPEK